MIKNAIILAGGTGSRLFPLTHVVNKHLLPVNGKFIIDYPLDTLKGMGVENCTVVLGGHHFSQVVDHLKDGSSHGMRFNYVYQGEAKGIAQAINLCQRFVSTKDVDEPFVVILGDNIYSEPIVWHTNYNKTQIVLYEHAELNRFGVATIDDFNKIIKIEEKPKILDYNYEQFAITGCYLFNQKFFKHFESLRPSARGEYEITDILQAYYEDRKLDYTWAEGFWSDAGTHESIAYCNNYFSKLEIK